MKQIKNESDYVKVMEEVEKLQTSTTAASKKKLEALYKLIEEYETSQEFRQNDKLDALREELAVYSEEEVKVFSVMAMKIIDYNKRRQAGEDVKFPKFDPELYEEMREWARLKAEINKLENRKE